MKLRLPLAGLCAVLGLAGCGGSVAAGTDSQPSQTAAAAASTPSPSFSCIMGSQPYGNTTLNYPVVTIAAPSTENLNISQMTVAFYDNGGNEVGTGTVYPPASVITAGQMMATTPEDYSEYQVRDTAPSGAVSCQVVQFF